MNARHTRPPAPHGGGPSGPPGPAPDALFDEVLRAARELLALRSPLDAELIVSRMLGTWWGQHAPGVDVEELIGEGLVDYAARVSSPASLALLAGIAYLGNAHQAAKAERAALRLMDAGVARPPWAERVGAVRREAAYLTQDLYGDRDEVVCTFTYPDEEPHALVLVVDYNMGGLARDAWVTARVEDLLERCRAAADGNPLLDFAPIELRRARPLLQAALDATDAAIDPPVSDNFAAYHAFARARVHALPPGRKRIPPLHGGATYGGDRRATLAAQFLASDEAEAVSDRSAAARCVDRIIDYGCDRDYGRPLRVSPTKVETFLLDWLPRKVMLTREEQEAMPHVLAAWVRWSAKRTKLPDPGAADTLDAIWNTTSAFATAYRDPASFGLDGAVVQRLLPDGELEALPRRAFAFPMVQGRHADVDLTTLDPGDPADRRELLRIDHGDLDEQRLSAYESVAAMLWDGDPDELWDAAQQLLDLGYMRPAVLSILADTVLNSGHDPAGLRRALTSLPDRMAGD